MSSLRSVLFFALLLALAHATVAEAGFVAVGSRSALAGTDNLDWGDLVPPSGSFPQPVTIVSDDGLSVVVTMSNSGAPISRLDQNLIVGWRGNFALGDELIYTGGVPDIMLEFPAPITAAGTQIQPATLIASFTARIEALDGAGGVLASFDVTGSSTNAEDNSAPFVGLKTTGGDAFAKIRITNLTTMSYPGIAINQFDFTPATLAADCPALPAATCFDPGRSRVSVKRNPDTSKNNVLVEMVEWNSRSPAVRLRRSGKRRHPLQPLHL